MTRVDKREQTMKRLRSRVGLAAVAALMAACTSGRLPDNKTEQMPSPAPEDVASKVPPPPLVPQPEGTPLPPRDPRIAERWPPEIKQLVDNMLTLYAAGSEENPLSVEEVEKKMGITLTERPLKNGEMGAWHKRYLVSGTPYDMDPPSLPFHGAGASYEIYRVGPPRGMSQILRLLMTPSRSGHCLDPYELAVYTGSTFMNGDPQSPHVSTRYWAPAYAWGMFGWSDGGRYAGQGFWIIQEQNRDPVTRKIIGSGCVSEIAVAGRYQEEQAQSITTINQKGSKQ